MKNTTPQQKRLRRRVRSRARMQGTAQRPRLSVFRSLRGMSAQIIDDVAGHTLVSVNSKKDVDTKVDAGERSGKTAVSYRLGQAIAKKAIAAGITTIVFDRSGYNYHGRVQALADGARDGGLKF